MRGERPDLQPAYILHQRPYRNSSRLLEVFSRHHGRFGMVARGVTRRRSGLQGRLQPFRPLLISWQGRGDLATMRGVEPDGEPLSLSGAALMSGFYLNELLLRLTGRHVACPALFDSYCDTLNRLAAGGVNQEALRIFECRLLEELGYGMILDHDVQSGRPIQPHARYCYHIERGPVEVAAQQGPGPQVAGSTLLALAAGELRDGRSLKEARHLMRMVLNHYLGGRPLRSRELFRALKE